MPNWISNKLVIKGEFSEVKKACDQVRVKDDHFDFNGIIPMPPHQPDVTKPNPFWHGNVGDRERTLYGGNNEYDWAIANWGVKWGAQEGIITMASDYQFTGETTATLEFNTAWAPVVELIETFSSQHPKLEFLYQFCDEDEMCNEVLIINGEEIHYEEIDYSDFYSDEDEDWGNDFNEVDLSAASKSERDNKDFVLGAVRYDGTNLEFASERLRDDSDVVLTAVLERSWAFEYASERLRDDSSFVLTIIQKAPAAFEYASERIRGDVSIVKRLLDVYPFAFKHCSNEIQDDIDLVRAVITKDARVFEYASERLRRDSQLVAIARRELHANKHLLLFLIGNKQTTNYTPYINILRKLMGEAFPYIPDMGLKNGAAKVWPFGSMDCNEINYFKHDVVRGSKGPKFIDFDWENASKYFVAKVKYVYWTTDKPLPDSKVYDGHYDYLLIPYEINVGKRILTPDKKNLMIEEVWEIPQSTLDLPIEVLQLGTSITNNLKAANYHFIKDFLTGESDKLDSVNGMSTRSTVAYKTLEEALFKIGVCIKKAKVEVTPSQVIPMTKKEAYETAIAIDPSDIDWHKFFAIHNDYPYIFADVSNHDHTLYDLLNDEDYQKVLSYEFKTPSLNFDQFIEYLTRLDESKALLYIGLASDSIFYHLVKDQIPVRFESSSEDDDEDDEEWNDEDLDDEDTQDFDEDDTDDLEEELSTEEAQHFEVDDFNDQKEELNASEDPVVQNETGVPAEEPIVYVYVGSGQYNLKTGEPNELVLEFIRRYRDFKGFDEKMFTYENLGFAIVVEIDHTNRTAVLHTDKDRMNSPLSKDSIFLKDFLK
jgi:hypothetical protein